MKHTAFVSHFDCSRHDTGWNHPDHQGRLPAVTTAVYRDMLTLFEPLLNVEGRHATAEEVTSVHSAEYLEEFIRRVDEASVAGRPLEVDPDLVVSGATADASFAAVGSALVGIETILAGGAINGFCAIRPPARDAGVAKPGRFGFLNPVAIAATDLVKNRGFGRVLVFEWGEAGTSADAMTHPGIEVVHLDLAADRPAREEFVPYLERIVGEHSGQEYDFVILSAGFDWLSGDPVGDRGLEPIDFHRATVVLREFAERACEGRLLSILEGGFEARALGSAVVQHIRGLAALPAAT